ncbi:MAG: TIGR03564 family F420-dependent LLM class oxidoreductase [Pseudomonadales bacterium]|nr:TIGR03564 family F420-dependent LLM class oxidoreductase [Pseudomonadales bacterium]
MRIGMMVGDGSGAAPEIAGVIERGRAAEALGMDSAWIANIALDALTASTALGLQTNTIEIGTAVMPTFTRHPAAMAQQTASTQQACEGRLALGIGLAHRFMVENAWRFSYDKPARHMRAYLDILIPLLNGEPVEHNSEHYQVNLQPPPSPSPTSVLVAALGPVMLRLAGEFTAGTITWATGLNTLEQHVVPSLNEGAERGGRATPRVVAGFPVVVTANPDRARELAAEVFAVYAQIPSYRAMLDREGVQGLGDLAIVGDENTVRSQLSRLESAGVTDLCAFPFEVDSGDATRTAEFLGAMGG